MNLVGPDGTTNASLLNTGINLSAGGTASCTLVGTIKNNIVINAW